MRSKADLSDIVHSCVVEALRYPPQKRFRRFFPLASEDFYHSEGKSPLYTTVEISMFEGRSVEAKKRLLHMLFERAGSEIGLASADLEITITQTPRHNWGIRGQPGDEIGPGYSVEA